MKKVYLLSTRVSLAVLFLTVCAATAFASTSAVPAEQSANRAASGVMFGPGIPAPLPPTTGGTGTGKGTFAFGPGIPAPLPPTTGGTGTGKGTTVAFGPGIPAPLPPTTGGTGTGTIAI